jgi:hypothetical protein
MTLQLGLVGLPNVGKSTLFNALTRAGAAVANYPFTTIDPNVGVVPVPDERLERIAAIIKPVRVVPASLRVVDVAGLVKGASQGEGLGNQFLAHIRGVDAIAMVVRCFADEDVPHVTAELDPLQDIETIELELALSDLDLMERFQERVTTRAKGHPKDFEAELVAIEAVLGGLKRGLPVRRMELDDEGRAVVAQVDLLTQKPVVYVANVGEGDLPEGGSRAHLVRGHASAQGAAVVVLCAGLEAELVTWEQAEAMAYRAGLEVPTTGLLQFIQTGYALLDYITFFTTTGGKEVRAWTLTRGHTALEAAGTIHTDMAKGFIRAEVVSHDDLVAAGSVAAAREAGHWRLEGKDYVVQDGDVLHVRFNV